MPGHKCGFPFAPYKIQEDLMVQIQQCLEEKKLGIFESPTGTGKTLSIICSVISWLEEHEKKKRDQLMNQIKGMKNELDLIEKKDSKDWFSQQIGQIKINEQLREVQIELDKLNLRDNIKERYREQAKSINLDKQVERWKKIKELQQKKSSGGFSKSSKASGTAVNDDDDDDDDDHVSADTDNLILEEGDEQNEETEKEDEEVQPSKYTQIFFCSRTHSQLSQFLEELKKTQYFGKISVVSLASRQNYCINDSVKRLGHVGLMNDKCIQMQNEKASKKSEDDNKAVKKAKTGKRCEFYPGKMEDLVADIVINVTDIEDLVDKANYLKTCPYYATRRSVPNCQLVLLPYNNILHETTRTSCGIDLKDNILVIDEAHNLLEAIERMYTVTVTGKNLQSCFNQLKSYHDRFQSRFSALNLLRLSQLMFCVRKLMAILGIDQGKVLKPVAYSYKAAKTNDKKKPDKKEMTETYTIPRFEVETSIDTVNVFDILGFVNKSKLIHKLRSYSEVADKHKPATLNQGSTVGAFLQQLKNKNTSEDASFVSNSLSKSEKTPGTDSSTQNDNEPTSNPILQIISFLEALKSESGDGRIFVTTKAIREQGSIKFQLMNPAAHFKNIISECRSVILAGGTMSPMSEFKDRLLLKAGADPGRITMFSCDHVIPKENLIARIITKAPHGVLNFTHKHRDNPKQLEQVAHILVRVCAKVPAGVVVFLPCYGFEQTFFNYLQSTIYLSMLQEFKSVFREPKTSSEVPKILSAYSQAITNCKPASKNTGALLFSVIGGKLSEGLNFSNDLGRCVIVIGLPYPNVENSPELQEKRTYLSSLQMGGFHDFIENTCMKAVNQCIGRAIRHANDYSSIFLIDYRYENKIRFLPNWIRRSLKSDSNLEETVQDVETFFKERQASK